MLSEQIDKGEKTSHTPTETIAVQILRKTNPQHVREHSHLSRMRQNQTTQIILWFRSAGVARSVLATDSLNLIGFSPVSMSNIVLQMTER